MSTPPHTYRQSLGAYYDQMSNHVDVFRWKVLKTVVVSLVFLGVYWVAVQAGADPEAILPWIVGGILITAGVEFGELEAIQGLSISIGKDD